MPLWGITSVARAAGYGADNYVLQHASNFYFGLVGMSLMHSCVGSMSPDARTKILVGAIGLNVGFNAIEEINVDGKPISRGASPRAESDWHDFGSGVAASALYTAAAIGFEAAYGKKIGDVCK